ncbi:hypothetical protein LCGC14_3090540 [marine sediment metagenome]|uniref:Uncharacterized protein n=1 Tax=marine sediment metagenome TaxID=412755 RepID=A0A0F8Z184_9ZZZZ
MTVKELIERLNYMPSDSDVVVYNSREELVIVSDITLETLCYGVGDRDGSVDRYHHPKLDMTEEDAVVIE